MSYRFLFFISAICLGNLKSCLNPKTLSKINNSVMNLILKARFDILSATYFKKLPFFKKIDGGGVKHFFVYFIFTDFVFFPILTPRLQFPTVSKNKTRKLNTLSFIVELID